MATVTRMSVLNNPNKDYLRQKSQAAFQKVQPALGVPGTATKVQPVGMAGTTTMRDASSPSASVQVPNVNSRINPRLGVITNQNPSQVNKVTGVPSVESLTQKIYQGQGVPTPRLGGTMSETVTMLSGNRPSSNAPYDFNNPSDVERYLSNETNKAINPLMDIYSSSANTAVSEAEKRLAELNTGSYLSSRLTPLEEMAKAQKEAQRIATEQRIAENEAETGKAREDLATRFAFSGFGRSDEHLGEQSGLAKQSLNIKNAILNQQQLENMKIDAELRGASEEELNAINRSIDENKTIIQNAKTGLAEKKAELRLKAMETGQTSLAGFQEQLNAAAEAEAKRKTANVDLSKSVGYLVNDQGEILPGKDGQPVAIPNNVDSALSKAAGYMVDEKGNAIMGKDGQPVKVPTELDFIEGTKTQQSGTFNPLTGQFTPMGGGRAGLLGSGSSASSSSTSGPADPFLEALAQKVATGETSIEDAVKALQGSTKSDPISANIVAQRSAELKNKINQSYKKAIGAIGGTIPYLAPYPSATSSTSSSSGQSHWYDFL